MTREDLDNGIAHADAIGKVKALLRVTIVVGHNIRADFNALELTDTEAHCVYDMATNCALNVLVAIKVEKPQSKLRNLAQCPLGIIIEAIKCSSRYR